MRYISVMLGLAIVGGFIAALGFMVVQPEQKIWALFIAPIITAAITATVSLFLLPVDRPDEVTGYKGHVLRNNVHVRPVTREGSAWGWRFLLLLIVTGFVMLASIGWGQKLIGAAGTGQRVISPK